MNTQTKIGLTKYTLLNGHIVSTLEQEYEKLRNCVLDRDAEGQDIAVALKHFTACGKKLAQAKNLKAKLNSKGL